jgi:7,8-dihydro-6-hydroxymethylpterin-pyrophosphokinase
MTPKDFLVACREIEQAMGRSRDRRDGSRTLDLDILFYGNHVISDPDLIIPHPHLHLRRFVLTPMVDLDPGWLHPVLGQTVKDLLDRLDDSAQVRRLEPAPTSWYGAKNHV